VLRDPRAATEWCRAHDLDPGRRPFTGSDLAHLRAVRTALRGAIEDPRGASARRIGGLARAARLGVVLGPDGPALAPTAPGADGVIGRILLDAVEAASHGGWARIRGCAAPGCTGVFVDTSRSGTRRWCAMATCGNRTKVRAHRSRARAEVVG
jgi:predicted RNA-binding Zn ribbon-like protein